MGGDSLYPEGWARAFVDYNRARVLPNDWVAFVGNTGIYKSLEKVQKKFGFDLHGEVKFCEPKDNDLTPERLRQISATDQALFDATVEIERQFQAKKVEVKK